MTREELIAAVNEEVDDTLRDGFEPSIGDEAFSESIIHELINVGTEIPESTRELLFGLLVVFEMRNKIEKSNATLQ